MECNESAIKVIKAIEESTLKDSEKEKMINGIKRYGYNKPLIFLHRVVWEITDLCNMNCKHCSAQAGMSHSTDLGFDEISLIMEKIKKVGIRSINFTGGEVFARNDVLKIFEHAWNQGFRYSFASNLTLINPEIVDFLKRIKPLAIQTSLDYSSGKDYDKFRGNPNAFNHFVNGLEMLIPLNISIVATCTVTNDNIDKLDEIIDFAIEKKIHAFTINDLIPVGRATNIQDQAITNEKFQQLRSFFLEKKQKVKDQIQLLWEGVSKPVQKKPDQNNDIIKSKCISCFERLNITNTGDLQPCNLLKINIGNILKDDFDDIWNHSEIVQRMTNKELLTGKCGLCEYKFSCGGCRARAYAYSGDYMGEDIRCV